MITTEAAWRKDGAPVELATPIAEIVAEMKRRAYVGEDLGTIGNEVHLQAHPPEDHTPYSQTGWPDPSPYPYVHALDWSGSGHVATGQHWLAMKRTGLATWVKYINLDEKHYAFESSERVTPSSDGPSWVHLSIRSDWTKLSIAGDWPTLEKGATGSRVSILQELLNLNNNAGLRQDSVFGPLTLAAVEAFQRHAHLAVDGLAGPLTKIALAVKLP